jgi:hypothetical protein
VEGVNEQALLVPQQAVTRDPKGNAIELQVGKDNKVEQHLRLPFFDPFLAHISHSPLMTMEVRNAIAGISECLRDARAVGIASVFRI